MTLSIYKIESEYIQLAQQLIDNCGEVTPELEQALAINQQQLETKGNQYAFVIKQMEAESEIIDAEIKRLQALKKSRTNASERMRDALSNAMQAYGIEEIKSPTMKINFRRSESIEVDPAAVLPESFMRIKAEPDKTKLKDAIKSGEEIEGVRIVESKSLQIR